MIRATITVQTLVSDIYEQEYVPDRLPLSPETTHSENRRAIRHFDQYCDEFYHRRATIDDLGKQAFRDFREWRIASGARYKAAEKSRPLSPATLNKEIRILRAIEQFVFDEFADQLGLLMPRKLQALRQPKRKPQAYSIDDLTRVLRSAMQEREVLAGVPMNLWWASILLAFYDTGYRKTTLLFSRWTDLDIEARILHRPAEEQKDDEDGAQELHPDTMRLILAIRLPAREKIWPWPFSAKSNRPWYQRLGRILDRAGLERIPKKPSHGFRSSHATYLADVAGIDAAAASCNHSSPAVTRDSYIDRTLLSSGRNASRLPRPTLPLLNSGQRMLFE